MQVPVIIGLLWFGAAFVPFLKAEALKQRFAFCIVLLAALLTGLLPLQSAGIETLFSLGDSFGAISFNADALGITLAFIATSIGSLCILFSWDYMAGHPQTSRYYALVLLFIGAMFGLVLSNSFLLLFFFWEITALCSYALIAFESDSPEAAAGGTRALIITQIGGIGLLFAALLVYQASGTYEIDQFLNEFVLYPATIKAVLAFGILAAAAAKSAQVPFQTWLAGAMEAPTPISALIHAATMVNAGVYLLIRLYPALEIIPNWKEAVMALGILSALFGAVMALTSYDLKRVLAYSTISQLGYMVYVIGLGAQVEAQIHLLSHALFKALLFLSAGAIIHNLGSRDMRQMGGLWRRMPCVRNMLLIGSAALVGIPIANGFWSKELIFEAALEHGSWTYWLMLFGVALTAAYTLRMLLLVLAGENKTQTHSETGIAMKLSLGFLSFGVLTSWLPLAGNNYPFANSEMLADVVFSPPTYLVLSVSAFGAFLAFSRHRYMHIFNFLSKAFDADFGFSSLNNGILYLAQRFSMLLGRSQTGILNWNIFGILAALLILLLLRGGNS